jgi:hypothetical protein
VREEKNEGQRKRDRLKLYLRVWSGFSKSIKS